MTSYPNLRAQLLSMMDAADQNDLYEEVTLSPNLFLLFYSMALTFCHRNPQLKRLFSENFHTCFAVDALAIFIVTHTIAGGDRNKLLLYDIGAMLAGLPVLQK